MGTSKALASLRKAAAANDARAFVRDDKRFNDLCLSAARNEFAASAMSLMHGLSRRFWCMHYRQAADLPVTARLHADTARARRAAGQHRGLHAGHGVHRLLNGGCPRCSP